MRDKAGYQMGIGFENLYKFAPCTCAMKDDRPMDTCGKFKLPTENRLLQFSRNAIPNAIQSDFSNDGSRMLIKEVFELLLPVFWESLHIPGVYAKSGYNDKRQRLLSNRCRRLPVFRAGSA